MRFNRRDSIIVLVTVVDAILTSRQTREKLQSLDGLCMKVGRGQRDRDACVRTWDLGTREEGLGDVKYRTRGRGDVKNWDAGDPG